METAKKLLSAIKKQPSPGGWKEVFGPNGSQKEIILEDVTADALRGVDLTSFCSSAMLTSGGLRKYSREAFPKSLHLGGDDWWPGGCGGDAGVYAIIKIKELNYPLKLAYWKDTEIGYARRGYEECVKLAVRSGEGGLQFSLEDHPEFEIGERPEGHVIDEYLAGLRTRFGFPDPSNPGVLDFTAKELMHSEFVYNIVPGAFGWDGARFSAMIRELVDESPMDYFAMISVASLGTMGKFHGKIQNLTREIQDLLDKVVEFNDFPSYDLTYYPIGAETWVKREKARKKLKKQTQLRELGIVTLDNGSVAEVNLVLSKEGYVFCLNFDNDDDLIDFYHSKLFKKTKWHSGAE